MDSSTHLILFLWILLNTQASEASSSCPSGWTLSGSSCYIRVATKRTWNDASADCMSMSGHLASIASSSENSVVYTLRGTSTSESSDVWIGLNDKAVDKTFVWSDGTVSSYRKWDDKEPNDTGDCVRMVSGGKWADRCCSSSSHTYYYVCEMSALTATTRAPTTTGLSGCRSGWTRTGLSCYIRFGTTKTWDLAEADCKTKGGNLASITSDTENTAVLALRGTSSSGSNDAWIGLNDKTTENTFVWSDGTISSYRKWDSSVPEPDGSGDCVRMRSDGQWRDIPCTRSYPYMCEYHLTTSPPTTSPSPMATTPFLITTAAATTKKQTTAPATTSVPTTIAATTDVATTATTSIPTTEASSTGEHTTERPTTETPTTVFFTTNNPTTVHIITTVRTVRKSTTQGSTKAIRTTRMPTTASVPPTTLASTTTAPPQTTRSPKTTTNAVLRTTTNPPTTVESRTSRPPTSAMSSVPRTSRHSTTNISTTVPSTTKADRTKKTETSSFPSHTPVSHHSPKAVEVGATGRNTTFVSSTVSDDGLTETTKPATVEKQQSSGSSVLYAGVATSIIVCVIVAVLVFVLLVWRKRETKRALTSHHRTQTSGGSRITDASPLFEGAHFTKRGSMLGVDLCQCSNPLESNNGQTRATLQATVSEDRSYLVPVSHKQLEQFPSDFMRAYECGQKEVKTEPKADSETVLTPSGNESIPVCKKQHLRSRTDAATVGSETNHYEVLFSTSKRKEDVRQTNEKIQEPHCQSEIRSIRTLDVKESDVSRRQTVDSAASGKDENSGKYWEPASTEQELYGQLEGRKFRHIDRRDVKDRQQIGSGAFGIVEKASWRVSRDKNITVAVKTLTRKPDINDRVKFLREAAINGQFRHRNVVRLNGVVTLGSPLMIVLEYMENGDLKNYLVDQRPQSPGEHCSDGLTKTLLRMCKDIANGMKYLASKLFVHRDLAARNILLDEHLTCKIGDFGMARDVSDDNYYVTKGGKVPLRWCSPEIWNYKKFSSASDVWSYGVVLYEVWAVGQRPFGATANSEVMKKVESGYRLPPPPGCSRSIYHLMIDCWNPDTHERPCFGNIVQRLEASKKFLLTNGVGEPAIQGNLGDELEVSEGSYRDLQRAYRRS